MENESAKLAKSKALNIADVISRLETIEKLCKEEANKNPIGKDLFQSGRQQAYSHIYFAVKPILERANWIYGQNRLYKVCIGAISFFLGMLFWMWLTKNGL